MQKIILTIKKTIAKGSKLADGTIAKESQRERVGEITVFVPTKDEVLPVIAGAVIAQAEDDNGKKLVDDKGNPVPASDEDGYPVYEDDKANWIFGALVTAAKAQARSRLQKDSVELKDGLSIAETLEALATAAGRSGGAALANMRETRDAFAKWVAASGKSAATQDMLVKLFKNKEALSMQKANIKEKMKDYIESFGASIEDEAALERYSKTIDGVLAVCTSTEIASAEDF